VKFNARTPFPLVLFFHPSRDELGRDPDTLGTPMGIIRLIGQDGASPECVCKGGSQIDSLDPHFLKPRIQPVEKAGPFQTQVFIKEGLFLRDRQENEADAPALKKVMVALYGPERVIEQ
jgi:hypothetical protein